MSEDINDFKNKLHKDLTNRSIMRKILFYEPDFDNNLEATKLVASFVNDKENTIEEIYNSVVNSFHTIENKYIIDEIEKQLSEDQLAHFNKKDDVVANILMAMDRLEDNDYAEANNLTSRHLVCSPSFFKLIRDTEHFDPTTFEYAHEHGVYGHITTLDIFISTSCDKNSAYIVPPEVSLGRYDTGPENDVEYITITNKQSNNYLVEEKFKVKLYNGHIIQKIVYTG